MSDSTNQYMLSRTAEEVDKAINITLTSVPKRSEITLYVANWIVSGDGSYYTHNLTIANSSANTRVDLDPTPEQFINLINEEISMFVANDNGAIKAYSIGGVPSTDMTLAVIVSEVFYE